MWYAYIIESKHTKRRYVRITEDWIQDWIDILQLYHSDMTLVQLAAAQDERLGIIADMRENETIAGYELTILNESPDPFSFGQKEIYRRMGENGLIVPGSGRVNNKNNQRVIRCSVDNEYLWTYPNVHDAAEALSIPQKSIYKAIESGGICHNYRWHWFGQRF